MGGQKERMGSGAGAYIGPGEERRGDGWSGTRGGGDVSEAARVTGAPDSGGCMHANTF